MRRIDFWSCEEVVERADSVPDTPHAEEFAVEFELFAHHVVSVGATSDRTLIGEVPVLVALALIEGVVDQHGKTSSGQTLAKLLVDLGFLALGVMAAGTEYCRDPGAVIAGQVEVGADK